MSNAEKLIEALASVFSAEEIEIDAALIERMIDASAPITADDAVMVMRAPNAL